MKSTYEGYALLLKEYEAIVRIMDGIKTDMSFLWMNTSKENFQDPKAAAHALKETGYLFDKLGALEVKAKAMGFMVDDFSAVACQWVPVVIQE